MKRLLSIILVILLAASGCKSGNHINKKDSIDNNAKVSIESEIKTYSPMMSSVPGLPLEAKLETNKEYKNITFQWVTEQGQFLTWDRSSGKINILGKDIKTNEKKLYWSIDTKENIKEQSFKIYLKVYDNDSSKLICETNIEIEQSKESVFSVKKTE